MACDVVYNSENGHNKITHSSCLWNPIFIILYHLHHSVLNIFHKLYSCNPWGLSIFIMTHWFHTWVLQPLYNPENLVQGGWNSSQQQKLSEQKTWIRYMRLVMKC